jgi:hypothetical protein
MKIYYQNILPPPGWTAMAAFGVILARKKYKPLSAQTINHEAIHAAQAAECGGWLLFYMCYLRQWIRKGFRYSRIPFEREAYCHDKDLDYLYKRVPFQWLMY